MRIGPLVAGIALAGCGRAGFAPLVDGIAASDGGITADGRTIDLPPTAMTRTFGETGTTSYGGVTRDTFISNEAGEANVNYGASEELRSELDVSERILLRFDLAGATELAGTSVIEASLEVVVVEANPLATLELHAIREEWVEGSTDGLAGIANFTERNATELWTTPGCGEPGSAGPVLSTAVPAALGPLTVQVPADLVQTWIDTGANFGVVLYNTHGNTARIASRNATDPAVRPILSVTFVP